jgi:hypothetical protein
MLLNRRHRHFNPASAGATIALDARTLTGLADGDPVATWTGRAGTSNSPTSSGGARPSYRVSVQGGQPGVRFASGSNYMDGAAVSISSVTLVIVAKWSSLATFNNMVSNLSGGRESLFSAGGSNLNAFDGSGFFAGSGTVTQSVGFIASQTWSGSSIDMWLSGVADMTRTISRPSGSAAYQIGAFESGYGLDGEIYAIAVVPSVASAALRRRIEQSLAFSFRIACA